MSPAYEASYLSDGESIAVPGNPSDPSATVQDLTHIGAEVQNDFVGTMPSESYDTDHYPHFGLSGVVVDATADTDASDTVTTAPGYPV